MNVLLVADAGGHLALMSWLARHLPVGASATWVTVDRPAARARLAGRTVVYAHGPTARSLWALRRNHRLAAQVMASVAPDVVVTTGAALGVPFVWAARRCRVPSLFVEVVDRVDGPSLAGRLMAKAATGVAVQLPSQADLYAGARVVGELLPAAPAPVPLTEVAYVTVGTHTAPMDRLVALAETLAARGVSVVLQHGASRPGAGCINHAYLPPATHLEWLSRARWLVMHGGSSTWAEARARGRRAWVVPRDPRFGEHVDDHQVRFVRSRGRVATPDDVLAQFPVTPRAMAPPPAGDAGPRLVAWIQALASSAKPST